MNDKYYTVQELAEYLHVTEQAIYRWVRLKLVPYTKFQRRTYFKKDDIEKIMEQAEVRAE